MNTKESSEIRVLKADELDEVSGGGGGVLVQIKRPPIGPAIPSPSPTSVSGYGSGEGGGGGGGFYEDEHPPYQLD